MNTALSSLFIICFWKTYNNIDFLLVSNKNATMIAINDASNHELSSDQGSDHEFILFLKSAHTPSDKIFNQ